MSKRRAKTVLYNERANLLDKEVIVLKRKIKSLQEQLKTVDLAIFACFQCSNIGPLGKVTDNVMERCRLYSDGIGEQAIVEITGTAPRHKRKVR